ncbi:hypothetical protein SDC9_197852 [bioreactor metagenome]|uniref:Uncharacterized protein n=1 Tax=bioreactor metagenome TaxID=1076179 RepID=A0A645IGW5_9ZZZZ
MISQHGTASPSRVFLWKLEEWCSSDQLLQQPFGKAAQDDNKGRQADDRNQLQGMDVLSCSSALRWPHIDLFQNQQVIVEGDSAGEQSQQHQPKPFKASNARI